MMWLYCWKIRAICLDIIFIKFIFFGYGMKFSFEKKVKGVVELNSFC